VGVQLTSAATLPTLNTSPIVINTAQPQFQGLRQGQDLTVEAGAVLGDNLQIVGSNISIEGGNLGSGLEIANGQLNLENGSIESFNAFSSQLSVTGGSVLNDSLISAGSVLDISGGNVGNGLEVFDSVVNVNGGTLGSLVDLNDGSVLNLFDGGTVNTSLDINDGSILNVSGGTLGALATANSDSIANITGGTIGFFRAGNGSTVNVSGGTFVPSSSQSFDAFAGSEVNLFGTEFFLDGVLVSSLVLDQAFILDDRDVNLSGILADGSSFSFDLNSVNGFSGGDFFDSNATLSLTRVSTSVPEPSSLLLIGLAGGVFFRRRRSRA